jgi:hypothetical protein
VLTDEELLERLQEGLSQLNPREDLVDELRRQAAADGSRPFRRPGLRGAPRRLGRGLGLAVGPVVAVIIAVAALTLAGHHDATTPLATNRSTSEAPGRDLKSLERDFSFLRRPQTAADRASPPGPEQFATEVPGMPRVGVQGTFVAIPRLTRLVTSQGVAVRVFVARLRSTRVTPASAATTDRVRRFEATLPSYELLGQVAGEGTGVKLLYAFNNEIATAFAAPRHRIFSLVPATVAKVAWTWPRLFNPITLNYNEAATPTAQVHDNIAVSTAPYSAPPPAADWYGTNGQRIRRLTNPDAVGAQFGPGRFRPAPETPLSRQAERDPATANRIVVLPAPWRGAPRRTFLVLFHVLIQGAKYGAQVTGGPHPGCGESPKYARNGPLVGPPRPRGATFAGLLPIAAACAGQYTVSVYVRGLEGRNYPPFGSATLTVK